MPLSREGLQGRRADAESGIPGQPELIAAAPPLTARRCAQQKRTSVTPAAPAPDGKAWMPRSCRSMCMVAASTSYEADAGPVPAATAPRYRPCRTTDTTARRASPALGDTGAAAPLLPEAEERTEGAGGLAAFFLGDLQRRGNVKVMGERRAHRGYRGTA